jgi:anti-sigma B factor antagonist
MSVDEQLLRVAARRGSDRLILALEGELDMNSAPLLREALASADGEEAGLVVLDLQDLSFIDSTGLKAIFAARNAVRDRGGQFAVTRGSAQVQRLLSVTRLDEHLQTIDSPDELLA